MMTTSPTHLLRLASLLWLGAGIVYLTSETLAASAFPGYSYAANYVSDLGIPYADERDGRAIRSGLAGLMNAGLTIDGAFFAGACIAAFAALGSRGKRETAGLALGLVHAIGTILVALVHSGSREVASGMDGVHVLGAGMSIVGGNLMLLLAASIARRTGSHPAYAIVCTLLGLFGLLSIVLLEFGGAVGLGDLPRGLVERCSIYPITAWEILTGLALLRTQDPARPASSAA